MSNRILAWTDEAWDNYIYWQNQDRKTLKKINKLLDAIKKRPFEGIGKPEPLKHLGSNFWSRRIDQEHRLIYRVEKERILFLQARFHYGDR